MEIISEVKNKYESVVEICANHIYTQIKKNPVTFCDDKLVYNDVVFSIPKDNSAELEILDKVSVLLDKKPLKTRAKILKDYSCKTGFTGCIISEKDDSSKEFRKYIFKVEAEFFTSVIV